MTDAVEVDDYPSLEAQPFIKNIFDQHKNANEKLAIKLGQLNLDNRRRLKDQSRVHRADKPAKTHVRVSGFNSVVTFEELNEQIHVPIPFHYGDDRSPNNNGSKIPRQKESNAYMPPPPWQVRLEAPFKCALCKKIVTLRGHEAWMLHVYADLKAYICIHPECNQSFDYYHLWAEHLLTSHFPGLKRYCVYCNSEINSTDRISTRNAFVEHLVYNHWNLSDAERTAATLDTEKFIVAPFDSFACGICGRTSWKTWFEYTAHVARHLEEISLAALPDVMSSLDESPHARKHRHQKRLPSAPKERTKSLKFHIDRIKQKYPEDEEETDSIQDDHDFAGPDEEVNREPLASVKKPHRDSLRPRKVYEKALESEQQQEEHEEPASSPHVKFRDDTRSQKHRKHSSHETSKGESSKSHHQPVHQHPNEDAMRSYQRAYQEQYEKQQAVTRNYQAYRYPAAYTYSSYFPGDYGYSREGYDYRLTYSGRSNDHANCWCPTCAAMREEYFGE